MIVCRNCKKAASISDESVQPVYNEDGQIIRWEHKECEYNEEESSSWDYQKRTK